MKKERKMKLHITEEIPIMKDFPQFIEYLEKNKIELTRTSENLKGPDLFRLNQLMSEQVADTTKKSHQRIYPVLHLFYNLVVEGGLFKKERKGSKIFLIPTERLKEYKKLTLTERYIFLLETFWVDCDWDKLQEGGIGKNPLGSFSIWIERIDKNIIGEIHTLKRITSDLFFWGYFLVYFSHFGFWEVTYKPKEGYSKSTYIGKTIEITPFGFIMMKILGLTRKLDYWNLSQRKKLGDFKGKPGAPLAIKESDPFDEFFFIFGEGGSMMSDSEDGDKDIEEFEEWEEEKFIEAFISVFPEGELKNTLHRDSEEDGFKEGNYLFKIILNRSNWCRVKLSAKHTLEDLHLSIAGVFDFWDDHLYAFFMDGKAWSGEAISDPRDSGANTDDFQIGELGLEEGQEIMYIFDYGSEIRFRVKLEKIDDEDEEIEEPVVVEERVKN
ncbi:hypothetical protein U472_13965 [Orenia metallireducens]|uniref:Plasmid pRiA4b Orf3-like domain-containing protein n=2 Tax=Orenia metallireducens TaxID=1413210 RepID=A0A1C0A5N4_9FIRM|nr:hypothetical protein U472_13965 [Orenia metallireducens]